MGEQGPRLSLLTEGVARYLGADACLVHHYDGERDRLRYGAGNAVAEVHAFRRAGVVPTAVMRKVLAGEHFNLGDTRWSADPWIQALRAAGWHSIAGVPIQGREGTLGLLLLPGVFLLVYASFAYAMTFFILADDISVGPFKALKYSRLMMKGMKWKFFCLNFRIIWWLVLYFIILTVVFPMIAMKVFMSQGFQGIVMLKIAVTAVTLFVFAFFLAYAGGCYAAFYDDVRGRVEM